MSPPSRISCGFSLHLISAQATRGVGERSPMRLRCLTDGHLRGGVTHWSFFVCKYTAVGYVTSDNAHRTTVSVVTTNG